MDFLGFCLHMVPVEKKRFYESLSDIDYEYEGAFRSLVELKRKHGQASCMLQLNVEGEDQDTLLLHPAGLDSAFQSLVVAYSYRGDHQLRKLHLPLIIECIRVNPVLCDSFGKRSISFPEGYVSQSSVHVRMARHCHLWVLQRVGSVGTSSYIATDIRTP